MGIVGISRICMPKMTSGKVGKSGKRVTLVTQSVTTKTETLFTFDLDLVIATLDENKANKVKGQGVDYPHTWD